VIGDNGAKFKVVVTNSIGNATSNEAVLTVVNLDGNGTGLTGTYFDNMDFTAQKLVRTDATVNFDWGTGSPDASIGVDTFSVRWTGKVQPRYSVTYTFYTTSDDGARLWVNSQLVVDSWVDQGPTEHSGTITLTAGQKYDIKMEYYENTGGTCAKLSWSSATQAKEIIPQTQLYPASNGAGDLNGDGIVNISDITLVVSHYGQSTGDSGWDVRADADGDGHVTINDITIVTSHYGQTY
jgi:hypothetical protein